MHDVVRNSVHASICAILLSCSLASFQATAAAGPARYWVDVTVDAAAISGPRAPFSINLDFAALLKERNADSPFVPDSVRVMRLSNDGTAKDGAAKEGAESPIDYALSEDFAWRDAGAISWVIDTPDALRYRVYFDTEVNGPFEKPARVPLIGAGDNFRYNRPSESDVLRGMGLWPILADFDGDGVVDLVSRVWYSSTWGQPWFTIWFWRNIGTNDAPVYDDFVRLYADGEPIDNGYCGCDLFDWDGDGRLDLVTRDAVYRNTGQCTNRHVPILTKLADIPPLTIKGEPYCHMVGFRDPENDGTFDLFFLLAGVHYVYEGPPARNFFKGALYRRINTAPPGQPPVFGDEVPVERDGAVWSENCAPADFANIDGDGDLDIVGNNQPLDRIPSVPQYCYWPNEAAQGAPPRYGRVRLIPNGQNMSGYGLWPVDKGAYHGLFAEDGYGLRYFERTGEQIAGQMPGFRDRGLLLQRYARCGANGFSGVDIEDFEGDGDFDIIAGDEFGCLWLIRNIGDTTTPVFAPNEALTANAQPIRIQRWHYVQDGNPEYFLGQAKPRYVDWDSDGDLDLIVANNTNRVLLFENIATRQAPEFARAEVLRVGDDAEAFAWRCGPSIVDWDADGLADLVTGNKDKSLCLFRQTRQDRAIRLEPGTPLVNESGAPIGATHTDVCDWDGDGDFDILCQAGEWGKAGPAFMENVGSNADPRFRDPVRLRCWGREITLCAHEHSFAAIDWHGAGKCDLVCGAESGLFFFFRRPALDAPAPPAATVSPLSAHASTCSRHCP